MKKSILMVLLISLAGCASITYENGDERIKYSRTGSMNLNGMNLTRNQNGITGLNVTNSSGDMGQLADVLNRIIDVAGVAAKAQTP